MTYQNGQIIVRIALSLGPNDELPALDNPAWTDLTDRVRAYRDNRGRNDALEPFAPGTAQITLDNSDRMLDPGNPDGLVFLPSGDGLPLCPVVVTQWWDGDEYRKFTGVLGPEAWPVDIAPKGPSGTVVLNVMDALGHSPKLPGDVWGLVIASLHPEWWSRMDDFEFPVLDDASPVPDSMSTATGTVEGTTGISRARADGDRATGIMAPGLVLAGDHQVRFPNASIMPDGDEDKFTAICWWRAPDELATGQADVMKMVHTSSGILRWSIHVDSADGLAYVNTYDATETLVDSGTITPLVTSRWDGTGQAHLVIARFDGADEELTVWFGGVSTSLSAPNLLYTSDLIIGPGNGTVDSVFDEVATWRVAFDYTPVIAPLLLGAAGLSWWAGHTLMDRLGAWIEATGRDVSLDDSDQWHFPSGLTDSLWGVIRERLGEEQDAGRAAQSYSVTLPSDLAEAFQTTVGYVGGARWATKDNFLRARSELFTVVGDYAEHYATPVLFTDEDRTLTTDEYRHAGIEVTGVRIDRVINDASVAFAYSDAEPPDIETASAMVCRSRDLDSIQRYGLRSRTVDSDWADWPMNQQLADLLVTRFAQPYPEFENVHLDPLGDDALAEWLITTCELELACTVSYASANPDPEGDPIRVTAENLNIQRIAFDWTPERWSVDLGVAQS